MSYFPGDVYRSVLDLEPSRLHGTRRVADDLYLIGHHEVSGKPYLSPRATGVGLAGGLLAELMTALRPAVTLESGYLFPLFLRSGEPVARYAAPDEPVAGRVLDLIVAESPPRPVRDWLLFVGQTAAAEVAGRLERAGYLARPAGRVPWRARRPVPVEADWSQCAVVRAHVALDVARPLAPYPALLCALALACGLGFRFSGLSDAPVRSAGELTRVLPRPLQELAGCVQAAADAAVLSART